MNRRLLLAEVLIAFAPLLVGSIVLAVLSLFQLFAVGSPDFHWESLALMAGLCAAAAIGGMALNAMRVYLFHGGRRLISRRRMAAFCAVGIGVLAALAALSLPGLFMDTPDYFGFIYLVPLLCALHILWLGRSYFTQR